MGLMYKIKYHKKAVKEIQKLKESKLDAKVKKLIELIKGKKINRINKRKSI